MADVGVVTDVWLMLVTGVLLMLLAAVGDCCVADGGD